MRKIKLEDGKEITISEESYNELSKSLTKEKKYELLTDRPIIYRGRTLYQIRALRDFGEVNKGELGGFIEKEDNLSHTGDCWVYNFGKIYGNAIVSGDAEVYDNAKVYGDAEVYDNAKVFEDARVFGNAKVFEDARVYGGAKVFDNAEVYGNAEVYDARVSGDTRVTDDVRVSGDSIIYNGNDIFCDV